MKKILPLFIVLFLINNISFAQARAIARGAEPGELYLSCGWYGIYNPIMPIYYDTLQTAVYRITENGKKLTIQYDADYFANPEIVMQPSYILADASSGVIYNRSDYSKNNYARTSLWVSFDYGKNWIFREEDFWRKGYYATNFEGIIYRQGSDGAYKSEDYGLVFSKSETSSPGPEPGLSNGEAFGVSTNSYDGKLTHTCNFYETYTTIPIDSQYVFGQIWGRFPDVYRGGLPGEVYVSSMFPYNNQFNPDVKYKVSFSADTGHTFRHVYESDFLNPNGPYPIFMSDREPGVFYIIWAYEIEDFNPWGWHTKVCIEYYRDYGETLVGTYCHDLHKNYGKTCEAVNDLVAEKINDHSILLTWSEPESDLPIKGYRIFRNHKLLTEQIITNTFYLDENLQNGTYEYNLLVYYSTGCISEISNFVSEIVELTICEPVNNLVSEKLDDKTVLLIWSEPESSLQIEGYNVFRNNLLQNNVLLTDTVYLDENLLVGEYEYYVVAHYANGCVSDSSNHAMESVGLGVKGVKELEGVKVWPNPTTGQLTIVNCQLSIMNVEIYDVYGRMQKSRKAEEQKGELNIDISDLSKGIYFVKIRTEQGTVVKKVVVR